MRFEQLAKYSYKTVNSSTGFTPNEAAKRNDTFNATLNMEMHRNKTRIFPDIEIGDYVRIHKKKSAMDKENVSTWSDRKYKVNNIEESHRQNYIF